MSGKDPLRKNLVKLKAGRVDFVPEDRSVLSYNVETLGLANEFEIVSLNNPQPIYAAFSPKSNNAEAHAQLVAEALSRMRSDGTLQDPLEPYGLPDWK